MARDDDDDRGAKKRSRDEDDADDVAIEEQSGLDRRGKRGTRDEDAKAPKPYKPMPVRLVGAIIAALAWGLISLNASCLQSSGDVVQEIRFQKVKREQEENLRKIGVKFDFKNDNPLFAEFSDGVRYTQIGVHFFFMFSSILLVAGGIMLLMRMSLGKFVAMGAPLLMCLVIFTGIVVCLIVTKGTFLTGYNAAYFVQISLSLLTGVAIIFLLLSSDVSKALK